MVLVSLATATICFLGTCYPALVGNTTPAGTFSLSRQQILEPGYGGDVLVYHEDRQNLWAIHRVYTRNVSERRIERLNDQRAEQRRGVTRGCINVMPEVYRKLVDCCSNDVVIIH